jgi:hypothetical protein
MTVIAWDGTTLAADTKISGHKRSTSSKLLEHEGWRLGICGDWSNGTAMRQWFIDGRQKSEWKWSEDGTTLVAISPEGEIFSFTKDPTPWRLTSEIEAWGSGTDFAMAAMHLGFDAKKAAQVAIELSDTCGGEVEFI